MRLLLAGGVLFVAVLAFVASTATDPSAGLAGIEGDTVEDVDPGSPIWRDGIRAGDRVLQLRASDEPGGWLLVATNGTTEQASEGPIHLARLRNYAPWSVVGVVIASLAALPAFRSHPSAAPILPITYAIATQPLFFSGNFVMAMVAGVRSFSPGRSRFLPSHGGGGGWPHW